MILMFWLTPLEAEIRRNHVMVERLKKVEKGPGHLFIPMPSTVMELPSMSKPVTVDDALIKTFAISV